MAPGLLTEFPISSTRDADEARHIVSRELTDVRFRSVRAPSRFRFEMNGVHLGRSMIGYNRFGTDTIVDPGDVAGCVVLSIGVGPESVFHIDGKSVLLRSDGAVVSPATRVLIDRPGNAGLLLVRAGYDEIEERFREVADRRPGKPIVFAPAVDLTRGAGARVRGLINSVVATIQRDPSTLDSPLLRAGLDDLILTALLSLPNSHSHELRSGRRLPVAPAVVRGAEEFLEAHATEPITISEVVAHCGCSRRSLFSAFRRFRGYTPMQFLARSRLAVARQALQSPSPGTTVASIARACGFGHPGRFSAAYRRVFGESPAETLRRS